MKPKSNTDTIKQHIIGPMNSLIKRVKKMSISHRTVLKLPSNRIANLETKLADLQNGIEETIEAKVDMAMKNYSKTTRTS